MAVSVQSLPADQAVFLFEDRDLVDATPSAKSLIETLPELGSEWDRLLAYLAPHFIALEDRISHISGSEMVEMKGGEKSSLRLRIEGIDGMLRVSVADLSLEGQAIWIDGLSQGAQEKELADLRETLVQQAVVHLQLLGKREFCWFDRSSGCYRDWSPGIESAPAD